MSWRNYCRRRAATVRTADAAASAKHVPGRVGEGSTTAVGVPPLLPGAAWRAETERGRRRSRWWCTGMTAVWMFFRAELRRRWRSWLVLALVAGLVGGLVTAVAAGARRPRAPFPGPGA